MLVVFVENRGVDRLVPLLSRDLERPPAKMELIRMQDGLGGKPILFRVAEVVMDVCLSPARDADDSSPALTVILCRQFTDADFLESIQNENRSARQPQLFQRCSPRSSVRS